MHGRLVAGIDLGSTSAKLLILEEDGDGDDTELVIEELPTPWRSGPGGTTDLPVDRLVDLVERLVAGALRQLAELTDRPIEAVTVAGMGESGVLLAPDGTPVAPVFAWFDPRGADQVAGFSPTVRETFTGRTGLPLGAQVSVAKLAHLRDGGIDLAGHRWFSLPEYVAMTLGGRPTSELSLASRTGLVDQDTGAAWDAMFHDLGATAELLAPLEPAGVDLGAVSARFGPGIAGARIAVAGHDHLVAAEAAGTLRPDRYHVSMGTAEVLLRVTDAPLGYAARARLAGYLINEVRHVVPGRHVLVAGVKTGLLLRRALQSCGITDRASRDRLDADVTRLPYEGSLSPGTLNVSGARNDDGVLSVQVHGDGVGPAELFAAVLRHSNDEIARLIAAMDAELPPARSAVLTGGWAAMESVRRARARILPALTVSERPQETAYGAARTALGLLPDPVT